LIKLAVLCFVLVALLGLSAISLPILYGNSTSLATTVDSAKSFNTVMSAIKADNTNENIYDEIHYNCVDFSWDTMRALNAEGIEARILIITYSNGEKHAVDIIPTSDKGWIVVEPQYDKIITPEVGKAEWLPISLGLSIPIFTKIVEKLEVLDYNFVDISTYTKKESSNNED